jgi:phenylalanyl-tRNA synthetase beta chain
LTNEKFRSFCRPQGILATLWQELHYDAPVQWSPAAEIPFLHPGKAAVLSLNGESLGVAGALHPTLCAELTLPETPWVFELNFSSLARFARPVTPYQPLPRFPAVVRDIALIADEELPAQAVISAVLSLQNPLIIETSLFDLYRGAPIPAQKRAWRTRFPTGRQIARSPPTRSMSCTRRLLSISWTLNVEIRT